MDNIDLLRSAMAPTYSLPPSARETDKIKQLREVIASAGFPADHLTDEQVEAAGNALTDAALRFGIFTTTFVEAFQTALSDPRVREAYLQRPVEAVERQSFGARDVLLVPDPLAGTELDRRRDRDGAAVPRGERNER